MTSYDDWKADIHNTEGSAPEDAPEPRPPGPYYACWSCGREGWYADCCPECLKLRMIEPGGELP
jgi:hypothetical protein